MATPSATRKTCRMTARKSPAVARKPDRKTGVVQGTITTHGLMRPATVAKYVMIMNRSGTSTKGIISGRLYTIG